MTAFIAYYRGRAPAAWDWKQRAAALGLSASASSPPNTSKWRAARAQQPPAVARRVAGVPQKKDNSRNCEARLSRA
jgi:hypothetical protein